MVARSLAVVKVGRRRSSAGAVLAGTLQEVRARGLVKLGRVVWEREESEALASRAWLAAGVSVGGACRQQSLRERS